ncbi:MAG: LacI family DNA-binding transcriptional regulator [Erysipelotrichaceae bacterium]|nr:LacI family DNA-binding transcriptional regulator [Erysipelotrichaceae bacterium]
MKRVTIYSVAHEAGVSLATVSRVINGSSVVREETRQRVQAAIAKLEYKPNAIAQGLALQKTTSIALVVPESSFSYIGKIINGLLNVAKIYKYNIVLHTSTAGINEMNEIIENIIKSHVDGVIVYNDHLKAEELNTLKNYNVPIVYIGNRMHGDNICSVFVDTKKAIYELVSSYLRNGIDDIGIIQDRKNPLADEQILAGAKEAFADFGKEFNGRIEIPSEYRTTYGYLSNYFKQNRHRLIIANRDSQALAALNSCQENQISVPDEVEIFCANDSKYNDMVRPQLSSFSIPSYDLGAVAMRIMTKMLNKDEIIDKEIELSYLFTPRQSTK